MDIERFPGCGFSQGDELTTRAAARGARGTVGPERWAQASKAAIELGVDDERRCPHCATGRCRAAMARIWSSHAISARAAGGHSAHSAGYGAVGLAPQGALADVRASLGEGETMKAAERCGTVAVGARRIRWRHRFLAAVRQAIRNSSGIVQRTRPYVLESRKGASGSWDRKPRRRGGKARKARPLARAGAVPGRPPDRLATKRSHLPALDAA